MINVYSVSNMRDIYTIKGEHYSYDENTTRIFKDGQLLSSTEAEPVFQGLSEDSVPMFAGIYLKNLDAILSLTGKLNPVTDVNTI